MVRKLRLRLRSKILKFDSKNSKNKDARNVRDLKLGRLDAEYEDDRKQKKLYGWLKVDSKFQLLKRLVKQRLVELITEVRIIPIKGLNVPEMASDRDLELF
jgi:hypothetical protein